MSNVIVVGAGPTGLLLACTTGAVILGLIAAFALATVSALQERVLHDPGAMDRLLLDLSVNVTAMTAVGWWSHGTQPRTMPHESS